MITSTGMGEIAVCAGQSQRRGLVEVWDDEVLDRRIFGPGGEGSISTVVWQCSMRLCSQRIHHAVFIMTLCYILLQSGTATPGRVARRLGGLICCGCREEEGAKSEG